MMKISRVKTVDGRFQTPLATGLDSVVEKLRSGENDKRVERIRVTKAPQTA